MGGGCENLMDEHFDTNEKNVLRVTGTLALGLPTDADLKAAALIIRVKGGPLDGKTIATGIPLDVARALRTALKVFIQEQEGGKSD